MTHNPNNKECEMGRPDWDRWGSKPCTCPDDSTNKRNRLTNITEKELEELETTEPIVRIPDDSTQESWEELFDEIEVERREYTPDQGMPSPIYEVNSDQMDYVVNTLVRTAIETAIKDYKAELKDQIAELQMFTGGSSVEPKDLRVKLVDILALLDKKP